MALRYDCCPAARYRQLLPPVMSLKRELVARTSAVSPLNQYLGSFCSAFADTGTAFTQGRFFDFRPSEGLECNLPLDSQSMDACLTRASASASERPLSFVVTVPSLDGSHSDKTGSACSPRLTRAPRSRSTLRTSYHGPPASPPERRRLLKPREAADRPRLPEPRGAQWPVNERSRSAPPGVGLAREVLSGVSWIYWFWLKISLR